MRKRRVVRRALWDVKPRHIVVFVDRVEQAGRAVRMRAEQPAWLQREGTVENGCWGEGAPI